MPAKVEQTVAAPNDRLMEVLLDHEGWPEVFRGVTGVHVVHKSSDRTIVAVERRARPRTLDTIHPLSRNEVEVEERGSYFTATLVHRFDGEGEATKYTVIGNVRFKGLLSLIAPMLGGLVRSRILQSVVEPMRLAVEAPERGAWSESATNRPSSAPSRRRAVDGTDLLRPRPG